MCKICGRVAVPLNSLEICAHCHPLPVQEVKLELDSQYVVELDGLANAYIAAHVGYNLQCNIRFQRDLIMGAYKFAVDAHEQRAAALEQIRKGLLNNDTK